MGESDMLVKLQKPSNRLSGILSFYCAFLIDRLYLSSNAHPDLLMMNLQGVTSWMPSGCFIFYCVVEKKLFQIFQPLNIHVALVGIEILSSQDGFPVRENGEDALRDFVHYRHHALLHRIPNDVAVLITSTQFRTGVVGKGLQGTICSAKSSGAVVLDHSHDVYAIATTIAHEIGHNFGMMHDTKKCDCPSVACIMAPIAGASHSIHWSSCSLEYLAWSLNHGGDACLLNEPRAIVNGPLCGNGFVEDHEQCDCGLPHVCDNPCCDPKTCKLKQGAACATGDCCNLSTCQLKETASVCRPQLGECDLPEYCDGKSEYCPKDTHKHDGTPCAEGRAWCANGQCGSLEARCKLLWGDSGLPAHHICYSMNAEGGPHGNCGINRYNDTFLKCLPQDMKCGLLQCDHKNERTNFGSKSTVLVDSRTLRQGSDVFSCQTALIDIGDDRADPGLVPNGADCGPGKVGQFCLSAVSCGMCFQQKCVTVSSVQTENACKDDCYGYGTCNNLGHCHCIVGYGGIDCSVPGLGGSIDSGPASATGGIHPGVGLAVFFFIFLPLLGIIIALLYRKGYVKLFRFKTDRVLKVFDLRRSPSKSSKMRKVSKWVSDGKMVTSKGPPSGGRCLSPPAMAMAATSPAASASVPAVAASVITELKKNASATQKPVTNSSAPMLMTLSGLQSSTSTGQFTLTPSGTLRKSNSRPKVPAPPRPPSPTRLSGERVYCEIGSVQSIPLQSPSNELKRALSTLPVPSTVMPQRRAPPPPDSPNLEPKWARKVEPIDAAQTSVRDRQKLFECKADSLPKAVGLAQARLATEKKASTLESARSNAKLSGGSNSCHGSLKRSRSAAGSQRRPQQAPPPPPKLNKALSPKTLKDMSREEALRKLGPAGKESMGVTTYDRVVSPASENISGSGRAVGGKIAQLAAKFSGV
ncbi:hypothetical protein M514_13664 [Trichuris suis]|uniref:Disintegrin n=1 Tax=Trichuris suis TaxID=68888 RepID=A0A085LKG3_9BILA|nr:hypothetical protein M513_13664 [Trichuris suis]KFD64350.1 hypothetical protein M514_13664 [Trichuris suis]